LGVKEDSLLVVGDYMTKAQLAKLMELIKVYLESLDDTHKDECYGTQRGMAEGELDNFLMWLNNHKTSTKEEA
jgi:hypothetical protein